MENVDNSSGIICWFCKLGWKMCLHYYNLLQAAVEASNSLPAVKWGDLMQPKLFRPLIVSGFFFYYCCLLIISMPAFSCWLIGKVINVPCFHVSFQRYIFLHCSSSFERAVLLLSLLTSFQSVLSLYHSIEVFSSIIMFFCLSEVVPLVQFYAFKRLLRSRICLLLSAFGIFDMIILRAS